MLFQKSSYEKIGGHESVRKHAADDLALAREVLKHRLKWKMHDATEIVSCRMYLSFSEAYKGFIKNYFSIFNYKILVSVFVWYWMLIICWYPLTIVIIHLTTGLLSVNIVQICYASIGTQALLWIIPVWKFKMPVLVIVLYPFIVLLASYIGFTSMFTIIFNRTSWKGRDLNPPKNQVALI